MQGSLDIKIYEHVQLSRGAQPSRGKHCVKYTKCIWNSEIVQRKDTTSKEYFSKSQAAIPGGRGKEYLGLEERDSESLLLLSRFSCVTLCDPRDGSPPGFPVPGILQARTLELGCPFLLRCMKVKVKVKSLSRVGPSATPWTAAFQAPLPMGFSRQEYWSGVPLPSPVPLVFLSFYVNSCIKV